VRTKRQAIRAENIQESNSPRAYHKPEESACQSEDDSLRHYLAHHIPPARAHRLANRHFFRAAACSDQQEINEVDPADEDEEKYPALNQ
jgi:hypothetical protein